ncbi:sialic acid-binding Ig-like lectin 12 isoform X2 [Poecilia latipinna]|uniref:sialic acid-binding Ig-like lectin 12 isoform X2 n=1 Tax=Poecilia latipinna TaxID=48699 RepID=UPI00072E1C1A|nr:PREDICTED: sialic acid-binding Ig-like lectin 12 isoform X2 [Poecilia latipinna]
MALTENMLTVNMLLIVFFLPGALANNCGGQTPALNITTRKYMEALIGSCLQIPCTYETEDPRYDSSKTIYGVWMKGGVNFGSNPSIVIFNSSGSVNNKYSLNMTGNLKEKNCTTLFPDIQTSHEGKYYFRVEKGDYRGTACADPLHITVKDSPWSPSINVPSDLKEHQSVTVTCSAFTPCPHSPPQLTWNLQQDSLRQTEKNTDGTFTTKIQENITLSDTHDGYNISCSARYPVIGGNKTAETEVTLSVSYAPRNTSASISPSGLVSAGSWVELSCSSRAKPPPRFTWFWNSEHGDVNVSVEQLYSFNVTEGGEFYCMAINDLGNQTSYVNITIEGPPKADFPTVPIAVGVSVAIIMGLCLVLTVWCFKSKQSSPQQTQSQTGVEPDIQISDGKETKGEVHYGEVNIIKKTPEASSLPVPDSDQASVYAQVKVPTAEKSTTQTAESPENLYAQVKKK